MTESGMAAARSRTLREWCERHPIRAFVLFLLAQLGINFLALPPVLRSLPRSPALLLVVPLLPAACALALVPRVTGWLRAGFRAPMPAGSLLLAWPGLVHVSLMLVWGMPQLRYALVHGYWAWVLFFAFLAALIGLAEEVWFRGLMFSVLRRFGEVRAALATSLAFGAMHLGNLHPDNTPYVIRQVVGAAADGLLYAGLVVRTRSIWPAVFLHGVLDFAYLVAYGSMKVQTMRHGETTWSVLERSGPIFLAYAAIAAYGYSLLLFAPAPSAATDPSPEPGRDSANAGSTEETRAAPE